MDLRDLEHHIDRRFDRLEEKLDDYSERLATSEADIAWLKGSTRVIVAAFISAAGFLASLYFQAL